MCRLAKSSHLPGHRNPARPSSGLSGRQLPGPRGTLLKKGSPRSHLPREQPLQLQAGFTKTDETKGKKRT